MESTDVPTEKRKTSCLSARGQPHVRGSNGRQKFLKPSGLPTDLKKDLVLIWPFGFRLELFQTRSHGSLHGILAQPVQEADPTIADLDSRVKKTASV